jgi:hypothetical protein
MVQMSQALIAEADAEPAVPALCPQPRHGVSIQGLAQNLSSEVQGRVPAAPGEYHISIRQTWALMP